MREWNHEQYPRSLAAKVIMELGQGLEIGVRCCRLIEEDDVERPAHRHRIQKTDSRYFQVVSQRVMQTQDAKYSAMAARRSWF